MVWTQLAMVSDDAGRLIDGIGQELVDLLKASLTAHCRFCGVPRCAQGSTIWHHALPLLEIDDSLLPSEGAKLQFDNLNCLTILLHLLSHEVIDHVLVALHAGLGPLSRCQIARWWRSCLGRVWVGLPIGAFLITSKLQPLSRANHGF